MERVNILIRAKGGAKSLISKLKKKSVKEETEVDKEKYEKIKLKMKSLH